MIAILLVLACYTEPEIQRIPTPEEKCAAMCGSAGVATLHYGDSYDCTCRVAKGAK